jgi:glycolate oxidase FAD binding subunit
MNLRTRPVVIDGVVCETELHPADEAEVSALVAGCFEEQKPLIPVGGGTQLPLGNPPASAGRIMDLSRLDRIVAHEAEDFLVTVQSGCPVALLQKTLRQANQWIPLDTTVDSTATIGGLIATNAYGPSRMKYGRLRDYILGLRIVQADGTITKAGGKVVKNVTGYDLCRLYAGSLGWLGIFTEFHMKTLPLSAACKDAWITGRDLPRVHALGQAVLDQGLEPSGMILSKTASGFMLCIRFDGHPEAVDWQWSRVCKLAEEPGGLVADLPSPEAASRHWQQAGLIHCDGQNRGSEALLKIIAPYGLAPALIAELEAFTTSKNWVAEWSCYAGAHILWARLAPAEGGNLAAADLSAWLLAFRQKLRSEHGEMILSAAPLEIKESVEVWGVEGKPLELMQGIKRKLDPRGILNPGRFVGRL